MIDARISRLLASLFAIIAIGMTGYVVLEHVPWFDAFYMTAITLTTVGFEEVWEVSAAGRIWSIFIMFSGIGMFFLIAGHLARQAVDFKRYRRFRMAKQISKMHDHFILCGYGRMGSTIARELQSAGKSFVVIENDPDKTDEMEEKGFLTIAGDATQDEILMEAGIERASTLIGVLKADQDNLFLTISARSLNASLYILTRATVLESIPKIRKAGADRVINPYEVAGIKLAHQAITPSVVDFLEVILSRENLDLVLETIKIRPGSKAEGQTMISMEIRKRFNIIITAIEQQDGKTQFNPNPDHVFTAGDNLIVLGNSANLKHFEKLCALEN